MASRSGGWAYLSCSSLTQRSSMCLPPFYLCFRDIPSCVWVTSERPITHTHTHTRTMEVKQHAQSFCMTMETAGMELADDQLLQTIPAHDLRMVAFTCNPCSLAASPPTRELRVRSCMCERVLLWMGPTQHKMMWNPCHHHHHHHRYRYTISWLT